MGWTYAFWALAALAFAGWMAYFSLAPAQGWEDLATLAGILVLSIPALIAALVLDLLAALKLRAAQPPAAKE